MLFDLGLIAKIADRVWILNWSRCPRNVGLSTRCRRRKAKRFLYRSIAASSYRRIVALSAGPPVSLDSINRGLMLPMSRENWVLKEATFGKIWIMKDTFPLFSFFSLSFIFFYFLLSIFKGLSSPVCQAPCIIGSPVKNDDRERTAVAAHFIADTQVPRKLRTFQIRCLQNAE